MGVRETGRDPQRSWKTEASLHEPFIGELAPYPGPVARTDKFLSGADKTASPARAYKTRQFNREPSPVLDLFFMDSRNKTIAVIDDDAAIRSSLDRLLTLVGYSVRTFANVQEFCNHMREGTAHCLVVDINLGGDSGLELAEHPKVAKGKIPVIFISGAVEDRIRARARAAGCIAVLSKPFKPVELLDAIFRATQDALPIP